MPTSQGAGRSLVSSAAPGLESSMTDTHRPDDDPPQPQPAVPDPADRPDPTHSGPAQSGPAPSAAQIPPPGQVPPGPVPPGQAPPQQFAQPAWPPAAPPQQRWWNRRVPLLLAAALLLAGCVLGAGVVAVGAIASHFDGRNDRARPTMPQTGRAPGDWRGGNGPGNRDGRHFPPGFGNNRPNPNNPGTPAPG